ncbi:MAG: hypothetical protein JOY82_23230 [Streptosporangiaceae bacterium]|nr:hypothetical protein [Streptosporangiaceae bacterium]MBV9857395.1 hypothetical protein [Streptosporangiaceae bacterium]
MGHLLGALERGYRVIRGYVTNLAACPDGAPVTYHRKRDCIEAHLTIVFAAPALSEH